MEEFAKKTKILCHSPWSHHNTGWPYCVSGLYQNLNNESGVRFYTNSIIGEIFQKGPLRKPWIGFLHATPSKEIEEQLKRKEAQISLDYCQGIYGLSEYVCNFIANETQVPTHKTFLAVGTPKTSFDPDLFLSETKPKMIIIGHWMRRFESIKSLNVDSYRRCILRCTNIEYPKEIEVIERLEEKEYENIFEKSLVFLDLVDSSANNTVVECIVHNTPILVNKLPALQEYLGTDYPLFYESLEEASRKCKEKSLVVEAHQYLKNLNKTPFQLTSFVKSVANSEIYKNLNLPKLY